MKIHPVAEEMLVNASQWFQSKLRTMRPIIAKCIIFGAAVMWVGQLFTINAAQASIIPIALDDFIVLVPCGDVVGNTGVGTAQLTSSRGHSITSDGTGFYSINCLPIGETELVVSKAGYQFLPERKTVVVTNENSSIIQTVNFAPATQTDPSASVFWGTLPSSGLYTSHSGMIDAAIAQACANGVYPELSCAAAAKATNNHRGDEKASSKNHDLNGCSPLDDFVSGPYVKEGGGIFGGVDNLWFRRSCMNHDNCFHHGFDPAWKSTWNAGTWGGSGTLNECNTAFLNDNLATCDAIEVEMLADGTEVIAGSPPSTRILNTKLMCKTFANIFYGAVKYIGHQNYHASARLSTEGKTLTCAPKVTGVFTTGVLGKTMRVDNPLADPDPYCHPAPALLTLSSKTSNSINIGWSSSQDATGYVVFRNGVEITGTIAGTSYNNTGLSPSTSYSYYVKAVFADLKRSAATATLSATTDAVNAPALSQYSLSANSVSLSWTIISGAQSYNLYRDGVRIVTGTTFTSHTDGGRAPGATHAYVVRSVGNGIESGPSNELRVTFPYTCNSALSASGSSAGLTRELDLGTRAGTVQVRFNAFTIPDDGGVKYKGASTWLVASGGPISGVMNGSFNYNPSINPRILEAKVFANTDTGTWWEMLVSCPGDPLPSVTYANREVSFWVQGNTCNVPWKMQIDGGAWLDVGIIARKLQLAIRKGHSVVAGWQGTCAGSSVPGDLWYRDGSGTYRLYPGVYGNGSAPTFVFEVK